MRSPRTLLSQQKLASFRLEIGNFGGLKMAWLAGLLLVVAASAAPEKKAPVVLAKTVEIESISQVLAYPARVESSVQATLLADAEGVVTQILPLGSKVGRGSRILSIQQTDPIYQYAPFKVFSPVTGVLSTLDVSEGTRVTRGQRLGSVIDPNQLKVTIEVASQDLPLLNRGDRGEFLLTDTGEKLAVRLQGLSPVLNPATGTATAVIDFSSAKDRARMRAGQIGRVQFTAAERKGILIPESAVVYRGSTPFVRVIENNVAKYKEVDLGLRVQGRFEIRKGLVAKDVIIERANAFVGDSQPVTQQN